MKKITALAFVAMLGLSSVGCNYGGMAAHSNGRLYIARNDGFLFGLLRRIYECTPDGAGNLTCIQVEGRP